MDLIGIIKNIGASNKLGNQELNTTREAVCQYPYFQMGYSIIAKIDPFDDSVQRAALYATDRSYLKALLNCLPPFDQCLLEDKGLRCVLKTRNEDPHECVDDEIPARDVVPLYFINGYIDDIFKRTPQKIIKTKNRLQYAIISKFIKANIKFQSQPSENPNSSAEDLTSYDDLAEGHIDIKDDLATERLAHILLNQGKVNAALNVYEKIIMNYPHKKEALNIKLATLKQNK